MIYKGNPFISFDVAAWGGNTYSMIFDGTNEYLQSLQDLITIDTSISVSFWIKTTSTSSLDYIVGQDALSAGNRNWLVYYRDFGGAKRVYLFFTNADGTTTNTLTGSGGAVSDGTWHHVVITYDGTTNANGIKMYVDGSIDVQGTAGNTGIRTDTGLGTEIQIGHPSTWALDASIDEVAIWRNTVLSGTDVTNIYNSGNPDDLTSFAPDIWYRMGDASGDTWDGSNWTIEDVGSGGYNADLTSTNMEIGDVQADVP